MNFLNVPVNGFKGDTWFVADLAYVGASAQYPGLYQVNFQLPAVVAEGKGWDYAKLYACGDYKWEISLDMGQGLYPANLIQIPVVVKRGDVPCAQ
jgi:hypothetical protein